MTAATRTPHDPNPGRLNIYTCDQCGQHIVTKDMDKGVTPFLIGCQCTVACHGRMASSFYRVWDPEEHMRWTHEWYHPSILSANMSAATIDHVSKGGLLLRARTDNPKTNLEAATVLTHKHVKRGTRYRVVAEGHFNIGDGTGFQFPAELDRERVHIYQGEDGEWQVRLSQEFNDGRFQKLGN